MEKPYLIEACVETVAEAVRAEKQGADQLELCSRLDLDGLTPPFELVQGVLDNVSIPIKAMIRPVPGGFAYTAEVIKIMQQEIEQMAELGLSRIVLGVTRAGGLDIVPLQELIQSARTMDVTIHRAIDSCKDPIAEIHRLRSAGFIGSILTSGGKQTSLEGAEMIREMIAAGGESIQIIAAGHITSKNLEEVHARIGAKAYHGRKIV